MATDKANFQKGQIIRGRYRITGAISWGAYALVYEAERLSDGQEIALKVLKTNATETDPSAVERFVREAAVVGVPHEAERAGSPRALPVPRHVGGQVVRFA